MKGWMESTTSKIEADNQSNDKVKKAADLIRANKHPLFYYLNDKKQGVKRESYIDLTSMCALPEEYFISSTPRGVLSHEDLYLVSKKIEVFLDLKQTDFLKSMTTKKSATNS